jgi:tetratricopeptide (TPR) repeat protein
MWRESLVAHGSAPAFGRWRSTRHAGLAGRIRSWAMLFLISAIPGFAHDTSADPVRVPEAILERPVPLRSGIGRVHQKVTTASAQAQAFYDQGLTYLSSYIWIEAVRSFHEALRLDPKLGMAWLGLADSDVGMQDLEAARNACAQAEKLQREMSPIERQWLLIRAREVDVAADGGNETRLAAYRQVIADAIRSWPRDPWLRIQAGLATEPSPFSHGQAGGEAARPFYEKALALDPGNVAASHYLAHVEENLGNTPQALRWSAIYVADAPAVPHAHHMHGHELMRIGRTDEALREFERAKELEDKYYRIEAIPAKYDWHHAHNLLLLAMCHELLGQDRAAEPLLREAFDLPAATDFLAYNRKAWPEFLIDRGRFSEAKHAAEELSASSWPLARVAGYSLEGEASVHLGRLPDAEQCLMRAEDEAGHLPERVVAALPYPAELKAAIALRGERRQLGDQMYISVEQTATSMPGPDGWVAAIFTLESIAREAREANDWDLARYSAEQLIMHDPYYAGGHFALGLVAEHNGEMQGARPMFAAADRLWSQADPDLPELEITKRELAATSQ